MPPFLRIRRRSKQARPFPRKFPNFGAAVAPSINLTRYCRAAIRRLHDSCRAAISGGLAVCTLIPLSIVRCTSSVNAFAVIAAIGTVRVRMAAGTDDALCRVTSSPSACGTAPSSRIVQIEHLIVGIDDLLIPVRMINENPRTRHGFAYSNYLFQCVRPVFVCLPPPRGLAIIRLLSNFFPHRPPIRISFTPTIDRKPQIWRCPYNSQSPQEDILLEGFVKYCGGDPYGIRTHDAAVKGRSLNHLTNGPYGSGNLI